MSESTAAKAVTTGVDGEIGSHVEGEEQLSLSRDETFEILSSHRRRYALHHLQQAGEPTDLGELSEHVAAWENETTVEDLSAAQRKRVYTSLQQFHLPKMDEKSIVEFDSREGVVELGSAAEDLDIYLEVVEGRDIPWSQYYLGLAAVNVALLAAATVDAYPISLVPDAGWGLFAATTFLVSALVHTYDSKTKMRLGSGDSPPEVDGP